MGAGWRAKEGGIAGGGLKGRGLVSAHATAGELPKL